MFETSNAAVYTRSKRITIFESVTVSVIAHSAAVAIAVAASLWNVAFPDDSPTMMVSFNLADPTPPPPPPAPPKAAAGPRQLVQATAPKPAEIVAPNVIPDEIPIVQSQIAAVAVAPSVAGVVGVGHGGTPDGSIGGVLDGDLGGARGGTVGSVSDIDPADHMIHIARDEPLPMFPLSQVYPSYPEEARQSGWEDDMVVRYMIGKDGRIKEVKVVKPPQHDIFLDGTVRAIRSWRFKPMIRDGQRQEVVHELTIQYRLYQEG